MLTLVTGPDAYLARAAVERLRREHDPDGLNTSLLDARSVGVPEITVAIGTPGFFGSSRVVIVHDLVTLSTKAAVSDEGATRAGKASIDWDVLFGAIHPANHVALVDREMTTVPAVIKRAAPAGTDIIVGDPPRGPALIEWIKQRAKAAESEIADMDARVLAETLSPGTWSTKPTNPAYDRPPDLDLFANEIEKLALAAYPGPISRQHFATMTAAGHADRLFPLIDAVVSSEGAAALRELAEAISNGNDTARVCAQLYQQFELLGALEAAGRVDPVEAGRALGLPNPNRMASVARGMRGMQARPTRILGELAVVERQFKKGVLRHPADQIYALIERTLTSARRTTESGT